MALSSQMCVSHHWGNTQIIYFNVFITSLRKHTYNLFVFRSVLKIAERRGARCANASNAVETMCNRLERHAAAFILSMLKTNAAAWRFHRVLNSTLWQRCGVFKSAVNALWARRLHAVMTPCKICIWTKSCHSYVT